MAIIQFLAGKKTYISAGALILVGVVLVWLGQSSLGMMAVLQGFGLVGLGAKAERHQSEILQAVQDMGYTLSDLHFHSPEARTDICRVVADVGNMAAAASESRAAGVNIVPCGSFSPVPDAGDKA